MRNTIDILMNQILLNQELQSSNTFMTDYSTSISRRVASIIDEYAISVFKVPKWILNRMFWLKLYSKFNKFEITREESHVDLTTLYKFYKNNKKVGEKKIIINLNDQLL